MSGRRKPASASATSGRRFFLGRKLPIPAWAVVVVGGALASPLGLLGRLEDAPLAAALLAPPLYGLACGALATLALGRLDRRLAVLGAGLGLAASPAFLVAASGVYPLVVLGYGALAVLPAALIARGAGLGPGDTNTFCALSLALVAGLTLPLASLAMIANRAVLDLPEPSLWSGVAAIAGALSWARPAVVRIGGPLN